MIHYHIDAIVESDKNNIIRRIRMMMTEMIQFLMPCCLGFVSTVMVKTSCNFRHIPGPISLPKVKRPCLSQGNRPVSQGALFFGTLPQRQKQVPW